MTLFKVHICKLTSKGVNQMYSDICMDIQCDKNKNGMIYKFK